MTTLLILGTFAGVLKAIGDFGSFVLDLAEWREKHNKR